MKKTEVLVIAILVGFSLSALFLMKVELNELNRKIPQLEKRISNVSIDSYYWEGENEITPPNNEKDLTVQGMSVKTAVKILAERLGMEFRTVEISDGQHRVELVKREDKDEKSN